jgi:hypothetical protein
MTGVRRYEDCYLRLRPVHTRSPRSVFLLSTYLHATLPADRTSRRTHEHSVTAQTKAKFSSQRKQQGEIRNVNP